MKKEKKIGKRQFTFILLLLAYKIEASYDVWAKNTHTRTYASINVCMYMWVLLLANSTTEIKTFLFFYANRVFMIQKCIKKEFEAKQNLFQEIQMQRENENKQKYTA